MVKSDVSYNIAVVINEGYLSHMFTMLNSLFLNNKHKNFVIYILNSSLTKKDKKQIQKFFTRFNMQYVLLEVDDTLLSEAPILDKNMSLEAYYKLLLPLQIPDSVERLLYLDSDIIINGHIDELYEIELDDKAFGAVRDYAIDQDIPYKTRLMDEEYTYFNSGVLLVDMIRLRGIYDWEYILKYIEREKRNFRFHDQEVLNAIFHKDVKILDEKFNYLTLYRELWEPINYKWKNQGTEIIVIHYAGGVDKPWLPLYRGKYLSSYWKYRRMLYGNKEYLLFQTKRMLCTPVFLYRLFKEHYLVCLKHYLYLKQHGLIEK